MISAVAHHGLQVHHASEMKRPLYTDQEKEFQSLELYVVEIRCQLQNLSLYFIIALPSGRSTGVAIGCRTAGAARCGGTHITAAAEMSAVISARARILSTLARAQRAQRHFALTAAGRTLPTTASAPPF